MHSGDFEAWDLDPEDLKMELQVREPAFRATLNENEYRRKAEETNRRDKTLEHDMEIRWKLVTKLKKEEDQFLSKMRSRT